MSRSFIDWIIDQTVESVPSWPSPKYRAQAIDYIQRRNPHRHGLAHLSDREIARIFRLELEEEFNEGLDDF